MEVIAAISDAHMGDGSSADDCNYSGLIRVVQTILQYSPTKFVWVGDMVERWQFSLDSILRKNKALLEFLNVLIKASYTVPDIEIVNGNHDPDVEETAAAIQLTMANVNVHAHKEFYDYQDWRFLHGHQLGDAWNSNPVLVPIAHGFTWFAKILEHAGIDENVVNPVNWVSPAKRPEASIHGEIQKCVEKYQQETGKKICYGHTHNHDLSKDRKIVNCGCLVDKRANGVVIFPDGNVNILEL